MSVSTPRYSYTDTSEGQLHLTRCGTGLPVVLMHWVPLSGRMYDQELPHLAARGYEAVAVDLIGFGRSSPRPEPWPASKHATLVAEGLKAAGISECAVLGAHFSAPVSVDLAAENLLDVKALLLDGAGAFLPEEAGKALFAKTKDMPKPGLHADGSHESYLWRQALGALKIFDPDFEVTEDTLPVVHRFIWESISTGMPDDFGAWLPYDMAGQVAKLTCPVCAITADTDPLEAGYEPTLAGIPGSVGKRITGAHPLHSPARAGEYADIIADFLDETLA